LTNESKKHKVLLDTKPLIKLFAKEEGWETIQEILLRIENGEIEAAITEIYYKYLHEKRADLAKARVEELRYAASMKKLGIDERIAIKAGEFKGKYAVPIADAYISATAYYNDSIVLSDDTDFEKIKEVRVQSEQEFLSAFNRFSPKNIKR
jgi:predicted nucleic acid-binding protein